MGIRTAIILRYATKRSVYKWLRYVTFGWWKCQIPRSWSSSATTPVILGHIHRWTMAVGVLVAAAGTLTSLWAPLDTEDSWI